MHIHFEKSINAKTDCTILSMSWMGKVPDELPEDEGWKLNRNHYYQEGWLASGNIRGILGVTYTTSYWKKSASDIPLRTNYNLRGHRAQVTLVQWNEPYQKLASCDSSGIIFVWIKFEGRWSIELINDRSTPVTHFSWSHDGRMALICYQDGFVLVGSVAGQRYWSTGLNLDGTITCGIWTPDDQQVYFGTSNGQIVVMDVHGTMLSQVQLLSDSPIASMSWSCEKFKMEENEEGEPTHYMNKRPFVLAVCFTTGGIYLMKNYDDLSPIYIFTGMHGLNMEWSNSGEFLAIAGSRPVEVINESGFKVKEYVNHLQIYSPQGVRILNITVPYSKSPITALTWGHNDKRIFVATGKVIHVGWVSKRIASLQLLCRLTIYKSLSTETCVSHLPLPLPVRALISSLHTQTILSILPNMKDLREFVSHPPPGNLRLHCTMIRHEDESNQSPGTVYTLYIEYLGGLIPILKGKRTSKIRPEFVIFDPQGSSEGGNFGVRVVCGGDQQQRSPAATANGLPGNNHSTHGGTLPYPSSSSDTKPPVDMPGDGISCGGAAASNGENAAVANSTTGPSSSIAGSGDIAGISSIGGISGIGYSDSSESEDLDLCASPRMHRKRYRNRQRERERMLEREREREWERTRSSVHLMPGPTTPQQLVYNDVLPESVRLVEVTSNIWGTKFKIHGLATALPENLGSVTYKTSLLHLQPRQMTLLITELRDDIFLSPDNIYSHADDEEEDFSVVVGTDSTATVHRHNIGGGGEIYHGHHVIYHPQGAGSPPVVPTNRCFLQPRSSSHNNSHNNTPTSVFDEVVVNPGTTTTSTVATPGRHNNPRHNSSQGRLQTNNMVVNPLEAYSDDEDEFPYVDLTTNPDMVHLREALRANMSYDYGHPTRLAPPCTSAAVQAVCQICEGGNSQSPRRSVAPAEESAVDLQERHNALQRVKSNLITRTQIENIDETNVSVASSAGVATSSPPSLHRTSGSIRSPTRICWSGHNFAARQMETNKQIEETSTNSGSSMSPPVIVPVIHAPVTAPIHVRRSMSASYLDSVERQGQLSLDIVNNDGNQSSPPKRLILVKKANNASTEGSGATPKPRLRECGKSKSWDSCDISWWRSSKGSPKDATTSPCPKCSFPSTTSSKKLPLSAVGEPLRPQFNVPSTPARSSKNGYLSNGSSSASSKIPQPSKATSATSNAHFQKTGHISRTQGSSSSALDEQTASRAVEVPATPIMSPTPARSAPIPVPSVPPTPSTTHRRSLSLLTPLLRRRDKGNASSSQSTSSSSSSSGTNPASSSFIPPGSPQHQPRSSPSTPATQRKTKQSYLSSASSPFRQLFANSPLLRRRRNKNTQQQQQPSRGNNIIDSSDDEGSHQEDNGGSSNPLLGSSRDSTFHQPRASVPSINTPFRDLETFQKQQLRQKLRKKKIHNVENCPFPRRREFLMHNKAPMWNENSQVYQLDFGGRVTQESAKNFQIEFRGKQVMQFGRIDGNAYTLDFQYPFSALQAFAVALANVTQRLK